MRTVVGRDRPAYASPIAAGLSSSPSALYSRKYGTISRTNGTTVATRKSRRYQFRRLVGSLVTKYAPSEPALRLTTSATAAAMSVFLKYVAIPAVPLLG